MIIKHSEDKIRIQIMKALADETRLNIVRTLYECQRELSCGEVGEKCVIHKATASYHFKTLREAGLTIVRKDARVRFVRLNLDTFAKYLPGFLETL